MHDSSALHQLATYRHFLEKCCADWLAFLDKRKERLAQWERQGRIAEKVAENILEDLLTAVLDWGIADLNYQVDYADVVITHFGIKRLLLETKRPAALAWHRRAVEEALAQARCYATEQKVDVVAVSDGIMFYAANVENGGLKDRLCVSLSQEAFPEELWWISRDGIYRPRPGPFTISPAVLPATPPEPTDAVLLPSADALLHPRYRLPAACFAYVGQADRPTSWKLPYRKADGLVDENRLPKAIQCILSNYRGARVSAIPEKAIPVVLVRLAKAALEVGKLPHQLPSTAAIYQQLAKVLDNIGRFEELLAK